MPFRCPRQTGGQTFAARSSTVTTVALPLVAALTLHAAPFLGRMNASPCFLTMGTIPVGTLIGGVLSETTGLRATLIAGGLGALLSVVWLVLSPA